jgi:hypothetical protein
MTIYETKVILSGSLDDIEKEGLKGWAPVYINREVDEFAGYLYDIVLQRPVSRYKPPVEVGEALTQLRNAKIALRHELGIKKQGSCGSALLKAEKFLESLYEED